MNDRRSIFAFLILLGTTLACGQAGTPNIANPVKTKYVPPSAPALIITPIPTLTPYIPPTVLASPPSNISAESLNTPDGFTTWYFTAVWQEKNYEYLWTFLTPSYQSYSGSFEEYKKWWSSVNRVEITSVNILQNDGQFASVQVNLAFYLNNGNIVTSKQYTYNLLYDPSRQTWMFDYR